MKLRSFPAFRSRSFTHDARGNQTGKVRPADTRIFLYDLDHRIVGEYGAGGASDLKAEYVWQLPEVGASGPTGGDDGTGGYMPLAVAVGVAGPTGITSEVQWVHSNHLGTPILTTNASGTAVTPYGYAAIGFPGQFANALLLPGAEHYYNRYRDYDPTTGRYIQADPIGLAGDANAWGYAGANPLTGIDPWGLTKVNEFSYWDDYSFWLAAEATPDVKGTCRIFGHGTRKTLKSDHWWDRLDRKLEATDVAKLIKERCGDDQIIELWSCETGLELAKKVSEIPEMKGKKIRAPTTFLWQTGGRAFDPLPYFPIPGTTKKSDKAGQWLAFQNGKHIP